MVFAIVTRASYGARLKLFQTLDRWKAPCMFRGFASNAKEDKKFLTDTRRGFEKIAEHEVFERPHSLSPIQPGGKSRVWGVNSFAGLPAFGGMFSRRCGPAVRFSHAGFVAPGEG